MNARNREAIEARIQGIADRDGNLTPDAIVEDAQNPESPLHGEFEWDDAKAAMEARRETARRLIRSVKVTIQTETHTIAVPRYVRSPGVSEREQSYSEAASLRGDYERAMASFAYEVDRAEAAIKRAQKVAYSLGLQDDVEWLIGEIVTMKQKVKTA